MRNLLALLLLPLLMYSCMNGGGESNDSNGSEESADTTATMEMERSDLQNAHLNSMIKTIQETPFTADEDGNISEMDSCCMKMMQFDKNGYLTNITEKNSEGAVTAKNVRTYSENGQFISSTWTEDGKEVWKRVVMRDADGEATHAMDSDSTKQVTRMHTVDVRNDFNQPVKGKSFDADSVYVGTWTWQYIDGNRVGRSWTDSSGVKLQEVIGEVNDKGWESKSTEMMMGEDGESTTIVETYSYDEMDDQGNWTLRTTYVDDKVAEVKKRSYTYYKD